MLDQSVHLTIAHRSSARLISALLLLKLVGFFFLSFFLLLTYNADRIFC